MEAFYNQATKSTYKLSFEYHPRKALRKMSYHKRSSKLELKLNLSPPRANTHNESPRTSVSSMEISPPSSCVSREPSPDEDNHMQYPSSPEATSMMLVGCPRCLMYVMLSEKDPKCPQCKSTVLLDFFQEERTRKSMK